MVKEFTCLIMYLGEKIGMSNRVEIKDMKKARVQFNYIEP
jgi:hypothetical protein